MHSKDQFSAPWSWETKVSSSCTVHAGRLAGNSISWEFWQSKPLSVVAIQSSTQGFKAYKAFVLCVKCFIIPLVHPSSTQFCMWMLLDFNEGVHFFLFPVSLPNTIFMLYSVLFYFVLLYLMLYIWKLPESTRPISATRRRTRRTVEASSRVWSERDQHNVHCWV